ncbi:MAG: carboxypeptidase M32 [Polyangia bacterium]
MSHPSYDQLAAAFLRIHHLDHLQQIVGWDQSTYMPPGGAEARGAALGEMAGLLHRLRTEPQLAAWLKTADAESLDETQRANLREMRRTWREANALPDELVQRSSIAASRCEHAWRQQRKANDWAGFLVNWKPVIENARREATLLAEQLGTSRYDALLDRYEPGCKSQTVERIFGDLVGWLPALIDKVCAAQKTLVEPVGPFSVGRQRALCEKVMHLLGFDFDSGRLDVSTHPFSGGVPEDVRLTTRYGDDEFERSLMGTIHETGHGRYEQNRPRDLLGQPISQARSMAIHESQSLSFEMQLGRSRAFVSLLRPLIVEAFGDQPAFELDNLTRLLQRVQRGYIRVDADEVTYPAHVILRFEIERALVEREIEAEDVPALWDEKTKKLLGLDTRGNFANGPMQDVHWPSGLFGYFPCYTLGAMYSAQWFARMREVTPDLDERILRGDLAPVFDWLRTNIWQSASRHETDELCTRATGTTLDPAHFRRHLERRYLG